MGKRMAISDGFGYSYSLVIKGTPGTALIPKKCKRTCRQQRCRKGRHWMMKDSAVEMAKRLLVDIIWKSANLEGLGTIFPKTEAILIIAGELLSHYGMKLI